MSPGGSVTAVHTAPYRIRAPIVRDVPAGQCGTENGVVVYAALIMAQENLPRPYHRKERPFWKSASADRPGPGFCPGKIGKVLEGAGVRGYASFQKDTPRQKKPAPQREVGL